MEKTTLEITLENKLKEADIRLGNRVFPQDIYQKAQMDDATSNLDSEKEGASPILYAADLLCILSDEQDEVANKSADKLLFERKTEV